VTSRLAILIVLLAIPVVANAHAEIFFPKLFSPAELRTSGFVLLNPDPLTANVSLYFVSSTGAVLGSMASAIPAGSQFAHLGNELFPEVTANGWVYVLTDTEGMQAFWLSYNDDLTFLDGSAANSYDTIGNDQVIPLVAGQTELNVINPNFLTLTINIRLFGSNGELAASISRNLSPAGAFQAQVSDLFPSADITLARYVRIQTTLATIASCAVIRGYLVDRDSAVINGINVSNRTQLTFPHVINGGLGAANYTTILGVTNVSASSQTVTMNFKTDSGNVFTVTRTIPPGGSLRDTASGLFSLPLDFQSGWMDVRSTSSIVGFAAYADTVGGGIAVVPAGRSESNIFFSHIANGPPEWQTGIALLNAGSNIANVEVYALNASGGLLGGGANVATARFTLQPGTKVAKVIDEFIPQTQDVNGGFVYVTADVPIIGIELFYPRDLKVLSNVAAARLVPGVAYRPPSP